MSSGRRRPIHFPLLLLLASLSLLASNCQSTPSPAAQPAGPTVQGPALIAYFTDN